MFIKTPSPKRKKQHCNINETTPSHHPLIIKTSQHHQHTSPRFHRNMPETSPTHQNTWSIIRRHTSHSYIGLPKGAQYTNSNWNLRFCLNPIKMFINVHQKIKTPSPKKPKQHCNINYTTASHHPLIIINITEPSPHITETSPKHARDVTNTSLKDRQNTNKKTTKQHRDITKKRQRHDRDMTETSPKQHRDKTKTRPRQDGDTTETRPRQDRDILGEFFSGACTAPGRLIHVRPQAYRYWGNTTSQPAR